MYQLIINFNYGKLEQVSEDRKELEKQLKNYKKEGINGTIIKLNSNTWDEHRANIKKELEALYRNGSNSH